MNIPKSLVDHLSQLLTERVVGVYKPGSPANIFRPKPARLGVGKGNSPLGKRNLSLRSSTPTPKPAQQIGQAVYKRFPGAGNLLSRRALIDPISVKPHEKGLGFQTFGKNQATIWHYPAATGYGINVAIAPAAPIKGNNFWIPAGFRVANPPKMWPAAALGHSTDYLWFVDDDSKDIIIIELKHPGTGWYRRSEMDEAGRPTGKYEDVDYEFDGKEFNPAAIPGKMLSAYEMALKSDDQVALARLRTTYLARQAGNIPGYVAKLPEPVPVPPVEPVEPGMTDEQRAEELAKVEILGNPELWWPLAQRDQDLPPAEQGAWEKLTPDQQKAVLGLIQKGLIADAQKLVKPLGDAGAALVDRIQNIRARAREQLLRGQLAQTRTQLALLQKQLQDAAAQGGLDKDEIARLQASVNDLTEHMANTVQAMLRSNELARNQLQQKIDKLQVDADSLAAANKWAAELELQIKGYDAAAKALGGAIDALNGRLAAAAQEATAKQQADAATITGLRNDVAGFTAALNFALNHLDGIEKTLQAQIDDLTARNILTTRERDALRQELETERIMGAAELGQARQGEQAAIEALEQQRRDMLDHNLRSLALLDGILSERIKELEGQVEAGNAAAQAQTDKLQGQLRDAQIQISRLETARDNALQPLPDNAALHARIAELEKLNQDAERLIQELQADKGVAMTPSPTVTPYDPADDETEEERAEDEARARIASGEVLGRDYTPDVVEPSRGPIDTTAGGSGMLATPDVVGPPSFVQPQTPEETEKDVQRGFYRGFGIEDGVDPGLAHIYRERVTHDGGDGGGLDRNLRWVYDMYENRGYNPNHVMAIAIHFGNTAPATVWLEQNYSRFAFPWLRSQTLIPDDPAIHIPKLPVEIPEIDYKRFTQWKFNFNRDVITRDPYRVQWEQRGIFEFNQIPADMQETLYKLRFSFNLNTDEANRLALALFERWTWDWEDRGPVQPPGRPKPRPGKPRPPKPGPRVVPPPFPDEPVNLPDTGGGNYVEPAKFFKPKNVIENDEYLRYMKRRHN